MWKRFVNWNFISKGCRWSTFPRGGGDFVADELSKIAAQREPVPPGSFVEKLTRPSVEARPDIQDSPQEGIKGKGIPVEEEAPGRRSVFAARIAMLAWAKEIWKYLHHRDLPDNDKSAECIARRAKMYALVNGEL